VHLDTETLERLLHDELDPRREAESRRHLDACPDCRELLADAGRREARIFGLFEELDHEPSAAQLALPGGLRAEREPARKRPAWYRIAASIALVIAAGGLLYALPGSPLREWISGPGADGRGIGDGGAGRSEEVAGALSGLTVRPDGPYEIAFLARQSSGRIRVELTPSRDVQIRVAGEPVGLESGPDRLVVSNAGSHASYEIRLPAAGPPLGILLDGRIVFHKEGDRVETGADLDPSGAYLIDLSSPQR
jgi:anti-sigma factor RsiW